MLAKLSKQPDYESVKQKLFKKGVKQDTTELIFMKKRHEDKENSRRQSCMKLNEAYEIYPFRGYTGNDPEAYYEKEYLKYIAKVDALDVDEILAMDLPKGLRM